MKAITNKTFAGFVQSLKQGVLDGYASCTKAEYRNGFYSAVVVKATDSEYVSSVTKVKEDECNAFKIAFFIEGLPKGKNVVVEEPALAPKQEVESPIQATIEKKPSRRSKKGGA